MPVLQMPADFDIGHSCSINTTSCCVYLWGVRLYEEGVIIRFLKSEGSQLCYVEVMFVCAFNG